LPSIIGRSVPEVYQLADAIEPRYRALVLLATFGNMRWGELAGLRRGTWTWTAGACGLLRPFMSSDSWSRACPNLRRAGVSGGKGEYGEKAT
jgi:hypothetical protein